LYRDGLAALEKNDWPNAVVHFESLQALEPGYRDVQAQRARAWKKLKESRAAENAGFYGGRNKTLLSIGLASLTLLVIWGVVAAWPHAQACYRLWRGDDRGAAQVYEKILQRHPRRAKLYSPLAEIYLLSDRKDDRAIKVYKAALQLNLAAAQRQEIKENVVQHYLTTDQIDDDAIPVLEEALKVVYNPRPQTLPVPKHAVRRIVPHYA
jgi:Tfp pilus assembly protein PilF